MNNSILLRDLLEFTKDGEWGEAEAKSGLTEMKIIRGTDFASVRSGELANLPVRFIKKHTAKYKALQPNDIIIETAGGSKGQPTGRTVFVSQKTLSDINFPVTCASFCRLLRVNRNIAYPEFVFWYLQYLYNTGTIVNYQVQHTGIARFQYTMFAESIEIPLPPLAEQQAIAHILSSFDKKIELNRRINETLEEIAHTIFRSWFVSFSPVHAKVRGEQPSGLDSAIANLFPSDFIESEIGLIPDGWKVGSIYDIANVAYGAPFASKLFNTTGEGLPLIRIRDLKDNNPEIYTPEQHPKAIIVEPDDIIVGMDGEFRVYRWKGEQALLNQRICLFSTKEKIPKTFLFYSLQKPLEYVEKSEAATTVIHLGKTDIDSFRILIPQNSILKEFSEIAEPLMTQVIARSKESRLLVQTRDALLPKLVSGEVRVGEVDYYMEEIA